jgi:hypothetical protein
MKGLVASMCPSSSSLVTVASLAHFRILIRYRRTKAPPESTGEGTAYQNRDLAESPDRSVLRECRDLVRKKSAGLLASSEAQSPSQSDRSTAMRDTTWRCQREKNCRIHCCTFVQVAENTFRPCASACCGCLSAVRNVSGGRLSSQLGHL